MPGFTIIGGPDKTPLHHALAEREEMFSDIYFVLQYVGDTNSMTGKPFRAYGLVDGLGPGLGGYFRHVTFRPIVNSDLVLTGDYNFATHGGGFWLNSELTPKVPVEWIGVKTRVWRALKDHGLNTLGDILDRNDWRLCQAFVPEMHGMPMTNDVIAQAVRDFELLRRRLDFLGYRLPGRRKSAEELYAAF